MTRCNSSPSQKHDTVGKVFLLYILAT